VSNEHDEPTITGIPIFVPTSTQNDGTATPRCKARTRLGSCTDTFWKASPRVSFVASSRRFPYRMFVRCWWVSRHEDNGAFTIAISHFLQSLLMTRVFWPSGLRVMRALELRTSRGFKGIKAARVDDRTSTEQQHLLPASTFGAEGVPRAYELGLVSYACERVSLSAVALEPHRPSPRPQPNEQLEVEVQ
jgi:hypothetical protein